MEEQKKLEILVVEDQKANTDAAKQFFESVGEVSVDYAGNFTEAVEKLQSKVYGAAILDVEMPAAEGAEVDKLGIKIGEMIGNCDDIMKYMPHVYLTGFTPAGHQTCAKIFVDESALQKGQGQIAAVKSDPDAWEKAYKTLLSVCPLDAMRSRVDAKLRVMRYSK